MEVCDELTKKRKRSFTESWLNDDRYKSWLREVPSDHSLYHCSICKKNFSCNSTHVSKHVNSACHKKNMKVNTLSDVNNDLPKKKWRKKVFLRKWLYIDQFKGWLREVPHDTSLFFCSVCDKSIAGGLSQISRHAESKAHVSKCESNCIEVNSSNEDSHIQINESLLLFNKHRKSAEMRYAALIADKNIPHQTAKEMLSFFQDVGKDPNVLRSMRMGRTKCTDIITNVLCPIETDRVVNKIQNTIFSVCIKTSTVTNDNWMIFLVRYVDPETLDVHSQLVKLINIDAKELSAGKLFHVFQCEMEQLEIPFLNIIALSCDNTSIMTGKHLSFKTQLEDVCPHLLTFSCPCHSAALAAHAACTKLPKFCEEFIKKIANYLNSSPQGSGIFHEFCECFQEKNRKILKLCDTRWLSHYFCVEKLLEFWDKIKYFLIEVVVSEKTKTTEYLLSMMDNAEVKAYFLFLKYTLNFFNTFIVFFQALETRIHLLQPKSTHFLFQICRNFLKEEYLKLLSTNIVFSLKENQKAINEIILGSECEEYLNELTIKGHINIVTTVRKNCLLFYVTAAEEIHKRLPINDIFLPKLQVFQPYVSLFDNDRETSFKDVSLIVKLTIGDFDEDALKQEWIALSSDFTMEEKQNFSKLNFDNMWKEILQRRYSDNSVKYPNLINVLNIIRTLPNSNTDPERMFSLLNNIKTKKRNKFSPASVNAICVLKSALETRKETAINMTIDENHMSLMSSDKLYTAKKDKNILQCAVDAADIAGPSSDK